MDELKPTVDATVADDRPALILLHAFPLDRRMWRPQIQVFGPQVPFAALDLPGFGESREADLPPDLDAWADAIVAALDQGFGGRPLIVAGLSMGGYVALRIAARHRARLAGLVLADTKAAADSETARAGRSEAIQLIWDRGPEPFLDDLIPKLLGPETSETVAPEVRSLALEQRQESIIAALEAMRDRPDSTEILPNLDLPTLLMVGEHDLLTPQSEAEAMLEKMPMATLKVIRGAGHLANLEQAERFTAGLAGFLNEHFSPAG